MRWPACRGGPYRSARAVPAPTMHDVGQVPEVGEDPLVGGPPRPPDAAVEGDGAVE